MTVFILQTDDYEPMVYGAFSTLELATEAARSVANRWDYRYVVFEYEIDQFDKEDIWPTDDKCHYLDFTPKKSAKWRA